MVTMKESVVVQRPQQEVFDYLTQVSKHAEWSPKPFRVEGDPGPIAMGTKWTSFGVVPGDKNHRNDVEVTAYTPPSSITWETSSEKQGRFVNTVDLRPDGSGTKVERTFTFPDPTGGMRVVFPLIKAVIIRPALVKGLALFKQRMESGSTASPAT